LDLKLGATVRNTGVALAIFRRTVSVDPPSIAAGAASNVDVTVRGVAVGDDVIAIPPDTLEAGLVLQGATVSAADTVRLRLYNPTAAAIDGAARTWTLIIIDRTPVT
jgi:hypothetical protein